MGFHDSELQHHFQQAAAVAPDQSCPTAEDLWRARLGELSPGRTRRIAAHLRTCSGCAEDWRLVQFQQRQDGMNPARPIGQSRAWTTLAAAVLLTAAGFWLVQHRVERAEPTRVMRGEQQPGDLISRQQGAALSREACLLAWSVQTPAPPVSHYAVRVSTDDIFEVVFAAKNLSEPRITIPPQRLAALPRGTALTWRVTVYFENGTQVSRVFHARLD
ncbi:zf-HC2 domain-containing protein [Acanthopleuribacter pedis]|uniref:Zf-HC2 domain-containing protein n=1 Tax=Acanthopleuribacter pedis TaxID=442870 RepID=A0A8J7QBE2_9BACT|nr:zf-HC2 domain-containing protein [Acanthopleuribacter pedis]MBO1320994.1 zf-HC2 domain-containing protein [Acanthopleuribacter pedis]